MAVFSGGRTFEALEAVCNFDGLLQVDVIDGVQSLLDNSLLQQREAEGGEPRFWMLETIQEYAREKLVESGEAEALQREHALYFLALAEEASQREGAEEQAWFKRVADEHDNMRVALNWARNRAAAGDVEAAKLHLQLAGALRRIWVSGGFVTESCEQLMAALSTPLEATGETDPIRARALQGAGAVASIQGDYDAADPLYEESLALYRKLGDKDAIAHTLIHLGNSVSRRGEFARARSIYEESLELFRELDDKTWIGHTLGNLGIVSWYQQNYATARAFFEKDLAIAKELGNTTSIAAALGNLGELAEDEGDIVRALALQRESLAIFRDLGDKGDIMVCLEDIARLLLAEGSAVRATELWAAAAGLREFYGNERSRRPSGSATRVAWRRLAPPCNRRVLKRPGRRGWP